MLLIYNIMLSIKFYFNNDLNKSYYSNIQKVKTEYYILSNNNCKIEYFFKQNTIRIYH